MGETAKILCPAKKVLVPDLEAGCSLADSCPAEDFAAFTRLHPDHTVLSYVNTTAAVKAYTDVVVTSTNASQIAESFPADMKLIFGSDRTLGNHITRVTGRSMLFGDASSYNREQFSLEKILELKKKHPEAEIITHPECKQPVIAVSDYVASPAGLLNHTINSDAQDFRVSTEREVVPEVQARSHNRKRNR